MIKWNELLQLSDWAIVRFLATPIISLFSKRAALIMRARNGTLAEMRRNQEETDIYKQKVELFRYSLIFFVFSSSNTGSD